MYYIMIFLISFHSNLWSSSQYIKYDMTEEYLKNQTPLKRDIIINEFSTEQLSEFLDGNIFKNVVRINFQENSGLINDHFELIAKNQSFISLRYLNIDTKITTISKSGLTELINSKYVGSQCDLEQLFVPRPRMSRSYFNDLSDLPCSIINVNSSLVYDQKTDISGKNKFWIFPFSISFRAPIGEPVKGVKILYLNNTRPPELQ